MKKKLNKIEGIRISIEASEALDGFKETSQWQALKEWMVAYSNYLRDRAFTLNEESENFVIRHTRYTAPVHALHELINFVERPRRDSDG